MPKSDRLEQPAADSGYQEHQRRQARLGLAMSPAERLKWLERKTAEMRRLLGRARGPGVRRVGS